MRISVFLGTCAAVIVLPLSTGAVAQRGQDSDRGAINRLDRAGGMSEFRQGKESTQRFQATTVGTRIRQEDPHHPTTDPHHPRTDPHHPATDPHNPTDPHHPTTDPHHGTTDPHHPTTDPHDTDPHHPTTDPHDTDPHHVTPG